MRKRTTRIMNISSKCCQMLKLVNNTSSYRNFRYCTTHLTNSKRLRLIEGIKFDKRVKCVPALLSYDVTSDERNRRYFGSTSRSNLQKKDDTQKSTETGKDEQPASVTPGEEFANLGLIARFKKMYKEYWYVLVPVHIATSCVWLGTFYYVSKSGMDIVAIMQSWNFNETLIKPFRDSSMGHVAVAYLLYKIATPARYTVTLGATTVAIKQLVRLGYIKPVPSRAQLMQIYQDKKESVQLKVADKKAEFQEKSEAMRDELETKKQQIMDDYETFKEEFKDSMKTVGTVSNPQPPTIPSEEEQKEIAHKSKKSDTDRKTGKSDDKTKVKK